MEIVQRRERSRLARIFRKLAEAFSAPEVIPNKPRIVIATDGRGLRSHCGVLLSSEVCSICGVRPSWRDEP